MTSVKRWRKTLFSIIQCSGDGRASFSTGRGILREQSCKGVSFPWRKMGHFVRLLSRPGSFEHSWLGFDFDGFAALHRAAWSAAWCCQKWMEPWEDPSFTLLSFHISYFMFVSWLCEMDPLLMGHAQVPILSTYSTALWACRCSFVASLITFSHFRTARGALAMQRASLPDKRVGGVIKHIITL